jgi:hypothetical protein
METLIKKLSDFEKSNAPIDAYINNPELSLLAASVLIKDEDYLDHQECKYLTMSGYQVVRFIDKFTNIPALGIRTFKGLVKFTV